MDLVPATVTFWALPYFFLARLQVCDFPKAAESDITAQTQQTLRKIDELLAEAGS